jgi:hypothetical protein
VLAVRDDEVTSSEVAEDEDTCGNLKGVRKLSSERNVLERFLNSEEW